MSSGLVEPEPDNNAVSPPNSPSTSPLKQPSSPQAPTLVSEKHSLNAAQERTPEKVSHDTPLEANELSYTFSPPAVLQTPGTQGESRTMSTHMLTTPLLQYIFSPPLTRSMSRRSSSGMTPTDSYER